MIQPGSERTGKFQGKKQGDTRLIALGDMKSHSVKEAFLGWESVMKGKRCPRTRGAQEMAEPPFLERGQQPWPQSPLLPLLGESS